MAEQIRIGDVAPRVHYVAAAGQTVFIYPFPLFEASDLEVRVDSQLLTSGYSVDGVGNSDGGLVTFASPVTAGAQVLLRRRIAIERTTDFQPNGLLRANTLNSELDRQTAALQEVADDTSTAIRLNPGEAGGRLHLPLKVARANRILGFDDVGDVTIFSRDDATLSAPFPGGVPRSVGDKLAERLSARDFGAIGDGVTDDTAALQAAMSAASAGGKHLEIIEGSYRITRPISIGGSFVGLTMRGTIVYDATDNVPALTIGDDGTAKNGQRLLEGLRVVRKTISDWSSEGSMGLLLRNLDGCYVEIRQVEGFTIGVRCLGDGRGFQENLIFLGRIVNNRIGVDLRTNTASGWNTSNRFHGGQFSVGSTLYQTLDRFGVRLSAEPGAYVAHNRQVFDGPSFALQGRNSTAFVGIPFLSEVSSRAIIARDVRMEACSAFVARHTSNAQDHLYEVAWASQGYGVSVDYTATSNRVGAVVRALHQAAAHREATRIVADVGNLRSAAIRWNATDIGFEKLACLSTNVSGTPSKVADFAFPALDSYGLTSRGAMLTGGRGLGFLVDTRVCREFSLAVDADNPRLIVQCFDANMALLTADNGNLVRASGMSMTYVAGPRWWQGNADLNDDGLTRLQVIRLEAQVAYAIIGVARVGTDYEVRAMRLSCDPAYSPPVLYGLPDLPHGVRELKAEVAWDPPSIAAGASATLNVSCPGVRPGDFVQAAFSLSTSGIVFLANVGAQDVITVTAWNRATTAIDLAAGTVRVRAVKT
ncbi:glycosyl hydrolase family 28-related protein [Roseomonas elaeocarpi]|uniref:Glycosyl hydrolase family 28-related protein n=1 Tax=Roseomonas elaeocarpi TaxID=907779 RepID=A0ABV6JQ82_9PROT